jgi:hypothetical protein
MIASLGLRNIIFTPQGLLVSPSIKFERMSIVALSVRLILYDDDDLTIQRSAFGSRQLGKRDDRMCVGR